MPRRKSVRHAPLHVACHGCNLRVQNAFDGASKLGEPDANWFPTYAWELGREALLPERREAELRDRIPKQSLGTSATSAAAGDALAYLGRRAAANGAAQMPKPGQARAAHRPTAALRRWRMTA
ncbi:hypothetical protein [uncultured Thiohalocapsa sp.]|uniref:hypothetical protein n=1 Tax=uncultured Thiohalocapsa sp. TaxID=768990 RepID=UPI0025DE733C|nr:hypothetical protein [uncultured Thiohalocapsa sp.]